MAAIKIKLQGKLSEPAARLILIFFLPVVVGDFLGQNEQIREIHQEIKHHDGLKKFLQAVAKCRRRLRQ